MEVEKCDECEGTGGPPGFMSARLNCRACEGRGTVPKILRFGGKVLDKYPDTEILILLLTCYWTNHPDYSSSVGSFTCIEDDEVTVRFVGTTRRNHDGNRLCIVVEKTDRDHAQGFDGYFQDKQKNPLTLTIVDWFYVSVDLPWKKS